jgi:hypothetical protein
MKKHQSERSKSESGNFLVMAVVLSFTLILLGLAFLQTAMTLRDDITLQVAKAQTNYDCWAGIKFGFTARVTGEPISNTMMNFYKDNLYGYEINNTGNYQIDYGTSHNVEIVGKGQSSYQGSDYSSQIVGNAVYESYADWLYISNAEHDSLRHVTVRFWTPDTLDGKVHSNDTIHITPSSDAPRFMKQVTTTANFVDPANNHARFDDRHSPKYGPRINFPDQATEIRVNAAGGGYWWHISQDSLLDITLTDLDHGSIYVRRCGPFIGTNGKSYVRCDRGTIAEGVPYAIPPSHVIFVDGRCWIKAARGRLDRMDGRCPESLYTDGTFISQGFEGQLTIGSSDTMIIPDNLIYKHARANNSVPTTLDSCSDLLGLVSEKYIMVGRSADSTIYINAAMAAVRGSISVQDIYWTSPPANNNWKKSLQIFGCLAQRNRGIVHSTDNPFGTERGFREKDYHYDVRLMIKPPPHFLPVKKTALNYYETMYGRY